MNWHRGKPIRVSLNRRLRARQRGPICGFPATSKQLAHASLIAAILASAGLPRGAEATITILPPIINVITLTEDAVGNETLTAVAGAIRTGPTTFTLPRVNPFGTFSVQNILDLAFGTVNGGANPDPRPNPNRNAFGGGDPISCTPNLAGASVCTVTSDAFDPGDGGDKVVETEDAVFNLHLVRQDSKTNFTVQDYQTTYHIVSPPEGGGGAPELSTWAMVIVGFGVVALRLRSRPVATRLSSLGWTRSIGAASD